MKSMTFAFALIAAAAVGQVARAEGPVAFTSPFAFATTSGVMPAGKYEMEVRSLGTNNHVVMLRHLASKQRNLFVASGAQSNNALPSIDFMCVEGDDCRLERVKLWGKNLNLAATKSRREARLFTVLLSASKPSGD